jgi:phosphate transport system permease protein
MIDSLSILVISSVATGIFLAIMLNFYLKKHRQKNYSKQVNKNYTKPILSGKNFYSNSLPKHYSYCFIIWLLAFIFLIILVDIDNFLKHILTFAFIIANLVIIIFAYQKKFNAQKHFENFTIGILFSTALIGIGITILISVIIFYESYKFFEIVELKDFFLGLNWNPQMAITAEQEVAKTSFGIVALFLGTILITLVAMMVAVPIGIISAIYLAIYSRKKTRDLLKPLIEILAGIPTVVYGYFAVVSIAPALKNFFAIFNIDLATESALTTGLVMGIMIIPFILSLTDDAINTVPQSLKDGALALGSTYSEMIKKVVLPSAMPSIIGAIILAISRAIGETMIVVMSAGLIAKLTFNPFESVTTATAQIVTLLVGDQEFDSPKTLSAFALALTLFIFTFVLNVIALVVIRNFKKKYS